MIDLAEQVLQGDLLALSRIITHIENGTAESPEYLDKLFPHTGHAHIIGITGPSGAGKSTLVNRLALQLVKKANDKTPKIGIIAVDPTSPFTGGALLGDRVRMHDLTGHSHIFIRSMATRGALGGLAHAADSAVQVMDAAGFDPIIVETVGAGQSEVEIAGLAHTTIVVEAPGLGDDIQAAKAGILEIGDILVVNKADKTGADGTAQALRAMLEMGADIQVEGEIEEDRWQVPVIQTSAIEGSGVEELAAAISGHLQYLRSSGEWSSRSGARLKDFIEKLLRDSLYAAWRDSVNPVQFQKIIQAVMQHRLSPHAAVKKMFQ